MNQLPPRCGILPLAASCKALQYKQALPSSFLRGLISQLVLLDESPLTKLQPRDSRGGLTPGAPTGHGAVYMGYVLDKTWRLTFRRR